jgi:hypothetical protein
MLKLHRLALLCFIPLAAACSSGLGGIGSGSSSGSSGGTVENTAPAKDALADPKHPGLEACARGDVDDNLEIAVSFRESCHEMVVCGGMASSLSGAIISLMLDQALGKASARGGLTFDGKGTWTSGGSLETVQEGTAMELRFYLGRDTSFGKKGELITFDLMDIGSYFTGASIAAEASIDLTGKTAYGMTFEFTGKKAGAELLGLGDAQTGVKVDFDAIARAIGEVSVEAKIRQADKKGHSTIRYDLKSPRVPLSQINNEGDLPFELVGLTGSRPDTSQEIKITKFDVRYRNTGKGILDGTIGFDVTGGAGFSYNATFEYPRRNAPDVSLLCK